MIRKAHAGDLDSIMRVIKDIVAEMRKNGSDQWDATYPVREDFARDIAAEELFVETDEAGNMRAFACINTQEPPEYKGVSWESRRKALVIHRMAVNSLFRRQGLAKKLMEFAEERAEASGIDYMKSDTYSLNTNMTSLFRKLEYAAVGNIRFPGRKNEFICYEKRIGE